MDWGTTPDVVRYSTDGETCLPVGKRRRVAALHTLSIGRDLRYQLKRSIAASAHGILRSGFLQWV